MTRKDWVPDIYAQWRGSKLGDITEALEDRLLLDLAGNVGDRDILEVGCGEGKLALKLSQHSASVFGIDASEAMIKAAKRNDASQGDQIHLAVGRIEQLPIASESFDLVLAKTVLCFVEDAAPVFEELARVLRPGGTLVIGELGKWSTWAAGRRIRAWLGASIWRKGRFRTKAELERLAEGAGISVHIIRGAVYYPRLSWAADLMAPIDPSIGRYTTLGAAFMALSGSKATSSSRSVGSAERGTTPHN